MAANAASVYDAHDLAIPRDLGGDRVVGGRGSAENNGAGKRNGQQLQNYPGMDAGGFTIRRGEDGEVEDKTYVPRLGRDGHLDFRIRPAALATRGAAAGLILRL